MQTSLLESERRNTRFKLTQPWILQRKSTQLEVISRKLSNAVEHRWESRTEWERC